MLFLNLKWGFKEAMNFHFTYLFFPLICLTLRLFSSFMMCFVLGNPPYAWAYTTIKGPFLIRYCPTRLWHCTHLVGVVIFSIFFGLRFRPFRCAFLLSFSRHYWNLSCPICSHITLFFLIFKLFFKIFFMNYIDHPFSRITSTAFPF